MGFFSQDCRGCERSVISIYAANDTNDWMMEAVALFPDGSRVIGLYNGYGRIVSRQGVETENAVGYGAEVWHQACWRALGEPQTFTEASPDSEDQGYFFDDAQYAHPEPVTLLDVQRIARSKEHV